MSSFESNLSALCKSLNINPNESVKNSKPNESNVFNSALRNLSKISHKPSTAKIDPLTLPFIR